MTLERKYKNLQNALEQLPPATLRLMLREPLGKYTSFKIGGPADLLALPQDKQTLVAVLEAARQEGIPVTLMGGGTNTLISDKGIRGLVIVLKELTSVPCILESAVIRADAGERLSTVCQFAMDQGLAGLEFAAGIPGTLGGAIMMNAGTAAWEISQIVSCLTVIDTQTLGCHTLEKDDLTFSYRQLAADNILILEAQLTLTPENPAEIKKRFDQTLKTKKSTQPISLASAGCFFKNPAPETPAGKLIEDAGLKGVQINGAQISKHHANFIVNTGKARCEDILALKTLVQKTVFEKYQIKLETEVKVTGE
jgi:UDP-N-acetylmuramate dehydrogenase